MCTAKACQSSSDQGDLQMAIRFGKEAADALAAQRDPGQAACLSNLGSALLRAYERTRELRALEEAVGFLRDAVRATPAEAFSRGQYLDNLAAALRNLAARTQNLGTLREAVDVGREAVARTPPRHHGRASCLGTLAGAQLAMFDWTGDPDALLAAVKLSRDAVAAAPDGSADHAGHVANLGTATLVWARHHPGEPSVWADAATKLSSAVAATPASHPAWAARTGQHAAALIGQFERIRDLTTLARARDLLTAAAESPAADITTRVMTLRLRASGDTLAADHEAAWQAMETVVELLPLVAPRALHRQDREYRLGEVAGIAAQAAACALSAGAGPERAVEVLEHSRGLLLGETMAVRGELTQLRELDPQLAGEFERLRDQLTGLESTSSTYDPDAGSKALAAWEAMVK